MRCVLSPRPKDSDRTLALTLTPVSRETAERLDRFVALLAAWQRKTNLIAASTLPKLWTRHVADSLQLVPLAANARRWVDLGSGGGFPGVPIGCALAGTAGAEIHLVESNTKKAAFLREAARIVGAPIVVHAQRIDDFVAAWTAPVDVVTARALAPLVTLLGYAYPLMERGAQALFLKGQDVEAELTSAAKCWNIEASLLPSKTSPDGRIVAIRRTQRRTSE